jgi:pimeloyl-ACP methyl ester carboxylesterase
MAPALSSRFRVYAVDVVGDMGKSIATAPPKTEEAAAMWIDQVLNGLELSRPILGGLSNGGYMAATYARLRPDRVERLILMAPAATVQAFSLGFYSLVIKTAFSPTDANIERFKAKASVHAERWSSEFTAMLAMAFRVGNIRVKLFPRNFTDKELRAIVAPTLLLVGEQEFIYSAEKAILRASRLIPNCIAASLPDCSHAMPIDAPDAAAEVITNFAFPR